MTEPSKHYEEGGDGLVKLRFRMLFLNEFTASLRGCIFLFSWNSMFAFPQEKERERDSINSDSQQTIVILESAPSLRITQTALLPHTQVLGVSSSRARVPSQSQLNPLNLNLHHHQHRV